MAWSGSTHTIPSPFAPGNGAVLRLCRGARQCRRARQQGGADVVARGCCTRSHHPLCSRLSHWLPTLTSALAVNPHMHPQNSLNVFPWAPDNQSVFRVTELPKLNAKTAASGADPLPRVSVHDSLRFGPGLSCSCCVTPAGCHPQGVSPPPTSAYLTSPPFWIHNNHPFLSHHPPTSNPFPSPRGLPK